VQGIDLTNWLRYLPAALGGAGVALLAVWLVRQPGAPLTPRVPGADRPTGAEAATAGGNPVLLGKLHPGEGQPATDLPGV